MRKEPPRGEELAVAAPHCYYGRLAWLQTSWIESNSLRRFFVCPKSEGEKRLWFFLYGLILKCLPVRELWWLGC
ncbi:uncharacterized protein Pyn_14117 [Prunus yedoensis var. nudiflora]|uniref:Uncharacterized protein n=1 Tax=Prunus yedoensis var. nudiflora TaxID=2094558 RepID=A0A314Y091_PRUYE|nr:uncharacterized protein Pyn_14117 [Prunus yedoensis var. nudiflora]